MPSSDIDNGTSRAGAKRDRQQASPIKANINVGQGPLIFLICVAIPNLVPRVLVK